MNNTPPGYREHFTDVTLEIIAQHPEWGYSYTAGYAAGRTDRELGLPHGHPSETGEYTRGYFDGYPRLPP